MSRHRACRTAIAQGDRDGVNLARLIDPHPAGASALIDEDGTVTTYGQLRRLVAGERRRLAGEGIGPGDRVAIISPNEPAFVVAYLAILGVGAIAVPLNPTSPQPELVHQLDAVEAVAVLIGPTSGGWLAGPEAHEQLGAGRLVRTIALSRPAPDADTTDAEAATDATDSPPVVDSLESDLAVLLFTAGTGGAPKAAMLTHGNLLANLEQMQRHPGRLVTEDDVYLGVNPLFHIFGLNVVLGLSLLAGGAVVLVRRFDPVATLDLIDRYKVTLLAGAPTMYAAWAAVPQGTGGTMASVRLLFSGAAPLPEEVAVAFERRFGLPLRQGYGLTEASPVVTTAVLEEEARPTSIGVPLPGVEVRLVDEDGEDALAGDAGEVWVRGPNVFHGYWGDEKASKTALTPDGWLRTGDVAVVGDRGDLYLVDRAKDLIIVSGFNVYPAEVEEVLLGHPAVAECAVVGVENATSGESVRAYVVLREGERATADELMAYSATRLARYKCPTEISFETSLPYGLAGKLLRRALRQQPLPEG
jgi:long-chain acyl-CoA synthetase